MKLNLKRALSSGIRQANRNKWIQSAGAICRDKRFHRFVELKCSQMDKADKRAFGLELPRRLYKQGLECLDGPDAEQFAVNYLRYYCKIGSRAELGFNQAGTQLFSELREEYYAYLFDER